MVPLLKREAAVELAQTERSHTSSDSRITSFLRGPWPVVLLLALYWWMAVSAQLEKSITYDELPHLTGGYSYWTTNDYRLGPEVGSLSQRWVALPLLFGRYQFPSLDLPAWIGGNVWFVGHRFFYELSNDLAAMLLSGRAAMALLTVGLGVIVYAWSRRLFGPTGGLVSLLLFVFCPTILAHGSLMTSDLPVTVLLTAAVWSFWNLLHHVSVRTVLVTALAMGGAFLAKLSGLVFIPTALVLLLIRLAGRQPLRVAVVQESRVDRPISQLAVLGLAIAIQALVIVTMLWGAYGFRYEAFGPVRHQGDQFFEPWNTMLEKTGRWTPVIEFARSHQLLPEAYLYQLAHVVGHQAVRRAFLNGEHRREGWWYFFPYVILVKTPLALFILLGTAAAGAAMMARSPAHGAEPVQSGRPWTTGYAAIPLFVLLGVYWGVALTSPLNIGNRHLLPTYPAMFILTGAAAVWLQRPPRVMRVVVLASLGWFVIESVSIRPHYLAYFNQLAGGPAHGYRHLVDSSLDWGQDLPGLKRWLDKHNGDTPKPQLVYLAYFGTGSPEYYGIQARSLIDLTFYLRSPPEEALKPLTGGIYCVSATMLQTVAIRFWGPWTDQYEKAYQILRVDVEAYQRAEGEAQFAGVSPQALQMQLAMFDEMRLSRLLAYLRKREPDDQVGYSILIYRLSDEQVREAVSGPAP